MSIKILSATLLGSLGLLAGCSQTSTVRDNSVAAQFARSMPYGNVSQNGQAVTSNTATNSLPAQVLQNIADAQAARNKPGNSNAGAVPTLPEVLNAISKAANQTAAQQQQQPQAIGPGPFITGTDANGQPVMLGPGPISTQFVPAMGSP